MSLNKSSSILYDSSISLNRSLGQHILDISMYNTYSRYKKILH